MREDAAEECCGSAPMAEGEIVEEKDPSKDLHLSSDDDVDSVAGGGDQCKPELEPAENLATSQHEGDGDGDDMPHEIDTGCLPAMPQADYPTLEEYQEKWARLLAEHERTVEGEFSIDNLIPTPNHMLWQDCPYVPFELLISEEVVLVRHTKDIHTTWSITNKSVQRLKRASQCASPSPGSPRRAESEVSSDTQQSLTVVCVAHSAHVICFRCC